MHTKYEKAEVWERNKTPFSVFYSILSLFETISWFFLVSLQYEEGLVIVSRTLTHALWFPHHALDMNLLFKDKVISPKYTNQRNCRQWGQVLHNQAGMQNPPWGLSKTFNIATTMLYIVISCNTPNWWINSETWFDWLELLLGYTKTIID